MAGLIQMDMKTSLLCPLSILMTFLVPMDENGEKKRATISDHVHAISQDQVSREDQL